MGKIVLIMRHAKSSWKDEELADHERPLTKKGKRDAGAVGAAVSARGLVPDALLSSDAKRARSTARRVARACGFLGEITYDPQLYLEGVEPYVRALAHLPASVHCAMVVGHNPSCEELVSSLCSQHVAMGTSALACIDLPIDAWAELPEILRGSLRFMLLPDKASDAQAA